MIVGGQHVPRHAKVGVGCLLEGFLHQVSCRVVGDQGRRGDELLPGAEVAVDADSQVGGDLVRIRGGEVDDGLGQVEHVAGEEGEVLAVGGAEQDVFVKVVTAGNGLRLWKEEGQRVSGR